jgi:alkanesulfonate monooxygenase SsuD/methylene tetrahydromethanopterin reductase-like flavin-dependent oxidoreductase (luciferase family)
MMRLGVFDHMDRSQAPLDQFFADRMRLIEAYDRVGFYGYHVAEHHATPLGVAPSPGVWLAAIAQRTTRLRFGALVYLLPLYHPLKLLEELCMLDQISRGRLLLGVGRGISPIELRYYGLDPAQTPTMYQEALEVILRGMACKELTFEGKYYTYRGVPMEMEPYQKPHPPLWYGIGRADAVPWAAQQAVNVVGNVKGATMRAISDRYRHEWSALGHPPDTLPLIGLSRHVVVAETEREALAVARRGYDRWRHSFLVLWRKHDMQLPNPNALFPETFEEAEVEGRAVAGPPDKVRDFLQREIDAGGLNYLLCRFAFGDIAADEALHSLDLFASRVMPDLHEARVEIAA